MTENDENATHEQRKPARDRRAKSVLFSIGDGVQLCRVGGVKDEE
ncbi:MAG: hypothetical protein ACLQU4_20665 [Limisphaerales bacterium]